MCICYEMRWRRKQVRQYVMILGIASCTIFYWYSGLADHFYEIPFSEFDWPSLEGEELKKMVVGRLGNRIHSYENDWGDFKPILHPRCPSYLSNGTSENFLLIVVKSAAAHVENRRKIRSTWGAFHNCSDYSVAIVYILGILDHSADERIEKIVDYEARYYGDILIGNFTDIYSNNVLKFLFGVQLAHGFCHFYGGVPYAFFVDDDYYVSLLDLVSEVKKYSCHETIYMGWRIDTSPFRFRFHKHHVSLDEYPYDRYPSYITAGAVLFSQLSLHRIYVAIQYVRIFRLDDIYCGIIANLLGFVPIHNEQMQFRLTIFGDVSKLICAHGSLHSYSNIEKLKRMRP